MITSRMKSTKIAAVDVNSPPPQPTPPTTSLMCSTSLYLKYTPSYSNSDKQFGHIYLFYSLIIKILVSCQSHFYGFHFYFFWITHLVAKAKTPPRLSPYLTTWFDSFEGVLICFTLWGQSPLRLVGFLNTDVFRIVLRCFHKRYYTSVFGITRGSSLFKMFLR